MKVQCYFNYRHSILTKLCVLQLFKTLYSLHPPPTPTDSLLTYNVVNLPHLYTIETNIIIITLRGLVSITASHIRKYYYDNNNHVNVSQWT